MAIQDATLSTVRDALGAISLLFHALAQRDKADHLFYFNHSFDLACISMRSLSMLDR
jgi:hypothetical protein